MDKLLRKNSNGEIEQFLPIQVSTGATDSDKVLRTNPEGSVDHSFISVETKRYIQNQAVAMALVFG